MTPEQIVTELVGRLFVGEQNVAKLQASIADKDKRINELEAELAAKGEEDEATG